MSLGSKTLLDGIVFVVFSGGSSFCCVWGFDRLFLLEMAANGSVPSSDGAGALDNVVDLGDEEIGAGWGAEGSSSPNGVDSCPCVSCVDVSPPELSLSSPPRLGYATFSFAVTG